MQSIKCPPLEELLSYENDRVLGRFSKIYGIQLSDSKDIFDNLLRWLWLNSYEMEAAHNKGIPIDTSTAVIDEMWHNFILFSRDYTEFCHKYFGCYIHHQPMTGKSSNNSKSEDYDSETIQIKHDEFKEDKRKQLELIYETMGAEIFSVWYLEYPERYSVKKLAQMHLDTITN
ncbi:hypothetical protein QWY20_02930 [Alkalimonas sp. MEB108]|uniref:Uncharacterized protein n=1 Tax=Alkalimonas cellulosilytica TaxID=3058395 RepID=A0ABU7J305_9GAMM|nr:hypothetical protein [Alkalimonas sp. MEB108]MEE2000395.1 hypothetical protein [Alkalimonas sp. MEB108]